MDDRRGSAAEGAVAEPLSEDDVSRIRRDFPILEQTAGGRPLAYLDNAATTQVPEPVLKRILDHYRNDNANVHRAAHALSARTTAAYEHARDVVAAAINARSRNEVVFTRGATDSINMVATGLASRIGRGDAVVVSALEHHANFVPWQQLCLRTGAEFVVAPLDERGDIDLGIFGRILASRRVAMVAVAHVSNVLGTVSPIARIVDLAHGRGARVLCDAAQSMRHETVDVQSLGCDFLCFSGHKMLAPVGIGVLYGRDEALRSLDPVSFGGEMVDVVSSSATTFADLPLRLEPGTPNYVGAIALAEAIRYMEDVGRDRVRSYERALLGYAELRLSQVGGIRVLGNPRERAGCVSFVAEGAHPLDIASLLDAQGVAVRSGAHCAQPLMVETLGVRSAVRVSPAFYNTKEEIDQLVDALARTLRILGKGDERS